ncbi:MAG: hypothetical protein JSV91_06000 [Phycisphaerales bacterium]|nr:MAG: hypothetical protein JSV91_06000 [Phycisphaerales bacterium]
MTALGTLVLMALGLVVGILLIIFVLVPLLKGIGWLIGGIFKAIGWLIMHLFEFIGGMISDALRFIGAIVAMIFLLPFVPLNIVIGRWSAAAHFAESIKRECKVGFLCLYRIALHRPLKLFLLHGLLEGVEQRVPEALAASPGADKPSKRVGQFDGYTIIGSLPGGGSGAKLYIAQPTAEKLAKQPDIAPRVVIKAFALAEGSSLPQIVRESRALEAAKQLGLVIEHGMDENRFFYIMPYHDGEHLGIITRQLHGETAGRGLDPPQLAKGLGYIADLLHTLAAYHRGGLWHKDVKPENVIVHDGRAHLVDLGLVTPLRSAMTLTTHGTEYFRDPEMVRQALRGVKVHQVNGAKFDIYAAGAVLYFVVENTFPAHGGLSRFSKKSPEALRWIIRRAMADYNQRYSSADQMLADLAVVLGAENPFAVKPVALPSMGGQAATFDEPMEEAPPWTPAAQVASVAAAHTPRPVSGTPQPPPESAPGPQVAPQRRPKLRVVNWWTGAYEVQDPGTAGGQATPADVETFRDQARAAREAAYGLRQQADQLRRQIHAGTISARAAARQQVRTARQRARDLRRQVRQTRLRRAHGKYAGRHPGSNPALQIIGGLVLGLVILGLLPLMLVVLRSQRSPSPMTVVIDSSRDYAAATAARQVPMYLYLDAPDPADRIVQKRLAEIIDQYEQENYRVIVDDGPMGRELNELFGVWQDDKYGPADELLEDALEKYKLYGVLHVTANKSRRLSGTTVFSERPGAENRRFVDQNLAPALPYLLVNDHPAKNDPLVVKKIESIVKARQDLGWTIITDDSEAEAEIRGVLPSGPLDDTAKLPVRLIPVLRQHDLGGVLWVEATQGDGPPHQRVRIVPIDLTEIPGFDLDLMLPVPPEPPGNEEPEKPGKPLGGSSDDFNPI